MLKRLIILLLLLALPMACMGARAEETAAPAAPAHTPIPAAEPRDGRIRVWLQSLGTKAALGMTLDGAYAVNGDRGFQFESGTEIALGIDGGRITLKAGGAAIDMGGSFALTRHLDASGQAGGVYIHESEKDTLYNGDIEIAARNGSLRVIVTLDIEDYLCGVVPYEMRDTFPIEALKAQAVAARTYAMQRVTRGAGSEYDLVDTANDQVYKGYDERYEPPIRAVRETAGIVGMHDGVFAECFYSASNGGQTALATDVWGRGDFAYLDMRDDPYDLENPESIAKEAVLYRDLGGIPESLLTLLEARLKAKLLQSGLLAEGEESRITGLANAQAVSPVYGGESRQYGVIRFSLEAAVRRLEGDAENEFRMLGEEAALTSPIDVDLSFYDEVRTPLGIGINASRYDLIAVESVEGGFRLINRRYGHGVGLSQRGAEWMAKAYGMDYLTILAFYYPGLQFYKIEWSQHALTPVSALPQTLGYAAPRPTPAPTPAPLPPLASGEYYATVAVEGVDATLNVREGPSTEHPVVGMIRNGARLIVQSEADGWARMKTAEMEGYVSVSFIEKE